MGKEVVLNRRIYRFVNSAVRGRIGGPLPVDLPPRIGRDPWSGYKGLWEYLFFLCRRVDSQDSAESVQG